LTADRTETSTEIKTGPQLLEDAQSVFRSGNQPLAMELFYAHTVAEYDQAEDALKAVRFSPSLRRPVWQIRWAVSLAVRGGDAENANPIPDSGSAGTRGGGSAEGDPSSVLEQALGLVASSVGTEFQQRAMNGNFGLMLGMLDVETPEESSKPVSSGGGNETSDGADAMNANPTESILRSAPKTHSIWYPGIVFLGEGASAEMVAVAKNLEIDFLIHFDIALKTDRDNKVENNARCRVIQVADGKTLAASKGIDGQEADRFSRGGRGTVDEYVTEQLAPVLAIMDQKVKVVDMPPLTPEIAKNRVAALLASVPMPGANKTSLRTLAEIRMYQSLGLLQQSDLDAAMDYIGGDEALFLIHGPLDARLQHACQWAVDALPTTK
jgi:hypothetical protein